MVCNTESVYWWIIEASLDWYANPGNISPSGGHAADMKRMPASSVTDTWHRSDSAWPSIFTSAPCTRGSSNRGNLNRKRDLKGNPLTDSMIQWPTDKVFGVKLFPNIWLRWHAGSWNIIPQNSRLSWSTKEKLNHIRVLRQFYSDLWYLTRLARRACHNSWEGGEEGRHGKWLTWINQHFDHQSVGHTNTWLPHGHTYIWSDISHTSAMIYRILSSIAWSYVQYMKITQTLGSVGANFRTASHC